MRYLIVKLLSASILAAAAVGCSYTLRLELHNNLNATIALQTFGAKVEIKPGGASVVDYPGDSLSWTLLIRVENCEYAYPLPRSIEGLRIPAEYRSPVKAKLMPDFKLLLGGQDAVGESISADPLRPSVVIYPASRKCN